MSEVQVPEGAMWQNTATGLFYRWADGEAWLSWGPGERWERTAAHWVLGDFGRDPFEPVFAKQLDSHKGYPRESLAEAIARKRRELQAAGVELESYIMPRDRPGIAAASAPAPAPDFVFELLREHEPRDGLMVVAPLGRLSWGL